MIRNVDGSISLEMDARLASINTDPDKGNFIDEGQLKEALKGFKLFESLELLASFSNAMYSEKLPDGWERVAKGLIRHKLSGVLVTQGELEYLQNLFIISGSNDYKALSIKQKDNLLAIFNIYSHSLIIGSVQSRNIISIMVTLWQEQFRCQTNDLQSYGRAAFFFQKLDGIIFDGKTLNDIFNDRTNLSIEEYFNIASVMLAYAITNPHILIGPLDSESLDFKKIIDNDKLIKYLSLYAATYDNFRKLDIEQNKNLDPKDTKNRFNPLWRKPILYLKEKDYLIPSITAFIQSNFSGLYWFFDDLFMNEDLGSSISKTTFREFFGKHIFEPYVGLVLKDIFGEKYITPEIIYGGKEKKAFTDWIAIDGDDAYVFEVKAYHFPFKTLQTGDLELIANEIAKKLVTDTIQKINKKIPDIKTSPELAFLKGKNIIPVVITYNVPLIDTSIYRNSLKDVLDKNIYQILEQFNGYLLNISDLEIFRHVSNFTKLKDVLASTKNTNSNFDSEIRRLLRATKAKIADTLPGRLYQEKMDYIASMLATSTNGKTSI